MRSTRRRFPLDIRTGWIDYSPALYDHASERVRSALEPFEPRVQSVVVRLAHEEQAPSQRRCEIEVVTADAGRFALAVTGVDSYALIDRAADAASSALRQQSGHARRRAA